MRGSIVSLIFSIAVGSFASPANAARMDSGTGQFRPYGTTAPDPNGGTSSGVGERADGAAPAEAAERAADDRGAAKPDDAVHPKSVQHQSTAQNPLVEEGPSRLPNPNIGHSPSENSPSTDPIGGPMRVADLDRAFGRIEAAASRAKAAAGRAEQAAERAEMATRRANEAFTRGIVKQ